MTSFRILVVTGGHELERLRRAIDALEWDATVVTRSAAYHAAHAGRYDAVAVDGDVADEMLGRLRRLDAARPLVVCLAASSSARVAELLSGGADEVLDGTMGDRELAARMHNAVRRSSMARAASFEVGALSIDREQGCVTWDGREVPLTRRERDVLEVLAAAHGRTVRREAIYRDVWGFAMARGDRAVDVNVKRLRDKLGAAGASVAITTQAGVGYRLEVGADAAVTAS